MLLGGGRGAHYSSFKTNLVSVLLVFFFLNLSNGFNFSVAYDP